MSEVLRWALDYLADAKYYKAQGKLETSLTSVAYCEGLLDGLRLYGCSGLCMANQTATRKQRVVLASGVFDLLHLGHVRFLGGRQKSRRSKR